MAREIEDVYFRRFVVPVVISILIMCGVAAIIAVPPGSGFAWNGLNSPFEGVLKGGMRRR